MPGRDRRGADARTQWQALLDGYRVESSLDDRWLSWIPSLAQLRDLFMYAAVFSFRHNPSRTNER